MNKQATIAAVLSVAAASGVTAGTLIHRAGATSPAAQPKAPITAPPTTAPRTTATSAPAPVTTGPSMTSTVTASHTASGPTGTKTTSGASPVSASSLLDSADWASAGVRGLGKAYDYAAGPQYSISRCPNNHNPQLLEDRGTPFSRHLYGTTQKHTNTYQLVTDARTRGEADELVVTVGRLEDDCGTPTAESPSQDFKVGARTDEKIPGTDLAYWWDTTFTNDGRRLMETVAVVRSGKRVTFVVLVGLADDIRYTDMTTLMTAMAQKMAP